MAHAMLNLASTLAAIDALRLPACLPAYLHRLAGLTLRRTAVAS